MKADLILEWPRIIGEDLGKACHVLKITFPFKSRQEGCLHLQTSGSMAAVLPYSEPLIIQRINQYYGYPAIGKIRIFFIKCSFADGPQHHKITSHGPLLHLGKA